MDASARPPASGAAASLLGFSLLLFLTTASTFAALGVVLPGMVRSLGWSWTEAGLGYTLLGAACGASAWLPALLVRRLGVRWTLVLGALAMAAGFSLLAACRGLPLYLAGCTVCGVAFQMTALIPGTYVLGAAYPRPAFAFGVYFTAGSLGGVAGPVLALLYLEAAHGAWRGFWILQAAVSLIGGAACVLLTRPSRPAGEAAPAPETPEGRSLREALATPQFWTLLLAYFAHLLCGATVASLSVAHLTERGVSAAVAGGFLSIESLMGILGRLAGGALADRIDPKTLLLAGLAAMAGGLLLLAGARSPIAMTLYAAGTGLGFGLAALCVTVLVLRWFGRRRNLEIFSAVCLIGAVSALGPVLAGMVRDRLGGFGPAFAAYAGVCLLAFFALALTRAPGPAIRKAADEPTAAIRPAE